MLEKLTPFLIAIALGFAIGLERERRHVEVRSMGVRTFTLLGLLGALAGFLDDILLTVVMAFFSGAAVIAGYIRTTRAKENKALDLGLTTEIAGVATFILGYLAHIDALLSAILGLFIFVVLLSRESLHRFSKHQVKSDEIQAAVILFILALGVLPLLPDKAIDPWELLNLRQLVQIVTLIAGVQFASYIAIRIFGETFGMALSGILGGFISSTAMFLAIPGIIKSDHRRLYSGLSASLFSFASTFILLLLILGSLTIDLFWDLLPILAIPITVGGFLGWLFAKKSQATISFPVPQNPISLKPAIQLALTLFGLVVLIALINRLLGPTGTQIVSFLGGLLELHGVSISTTLLYLDKALTQTDAKNSILAAVFASVLSKIMISWILDRGRYSAIISLVLASTMCLMGLVWMVVQ